MYCLLLQQNHFNGAYTVPLIYSLSSLPFAGPSSARAGGGGASLSCAIRRQVVRLAALLGFCKRGS